MKADGDATAALQADFAGAAPWAGGAAGPLAGPAGASMRRSAFSLAFFFAALAACAAGSHEKPGDIRFDVTNRVEQSRLPVTAGPLTLSLWTPLSPSAGVSNLAQLLIYREAARRTGVTIRFIHPRAGREAEELAGLLASRNLPDMIAARWDEIPGGPSKAIADGRIIPLNGVIESYMPAFRAILARHPEKARELRTDEGHYWGFPVLAWDAGEAAASVGARYGLQVRSDLLRKLTISSPETIDEWDAALRSLKAAKAAEAAGGVDAPLLLYFPYLVLTDVFASAEGASFGFVRMDGKVHYGPMEPGFRDFLGLLSGWVKDGLLNADLGTVALAAADARIASGRAAAWVQSADGMARLQAALRGSEPQATIAPLPPPERQKGQLPLLAYTDSWSGVIGDRMLAFSSANNRLEVSGLWVDFWYSDEGVRLQHYGVRGETYRLTADGRPELTPEGRAGRFNGGGLTLFGAFDLAAWRSQSPLLAEAAPVWARAATSEHALPRLFPLAHEAGLEASILPRARELVNEAAIAIISGAEPLESYGSTVKRLEQLGIGDAVAAEQAELDRYMER